LAAKLGESYHVLRLPDGYTKSDLHHQRYRIDQQHYPARHKEAQGVHDRRLSEEGGVAGDPIGITEMDDAAERLAHGDEPLYYIIEFVDRLDSHF
jgi:hypothetical protein